MQCLLESFLPLTDGLSLLGGEPMHSTNIEGSTKLAKAFKTSAQFWLNLQQQYDLWQAKQHVNLDDIEQII